MFDGGSALRLPGYRITGELHRSGVSIVYLAQDERLGRRVVVKTLREPLAADRRFRERFLCECRVAAGLDHPNIVPVYHFGDAGDTLFVVLPYIRGGDLQALLDAHGPLPPRRAASIVAQAAAALDHIHERGLVHRDVKPKNVLLDSSSGSRAYLCDFGITAGCHCPELEAIVSPGSVGFRAPEQVAGQWVDRRADVYSLACLLFACLTAASPAGGGRVLGGLGAVVARGMATDPRDRYPTCGDLAADLRSWVKVAQQVGGDLDDVVGVGDALAV
ncbi:serine/threonine-protein kinase [Actinophytocola sp.]|uniref:serine/threonine-protein kinase n=1 Tax=Actinophytocola sp. TaxID=1872138 RepID=UPI002D7FF694|nr:serine/threonine-protein kinase [Actinophytocola sp.]HET9143887.1 serine/threonine-protein kinase [Actinophytocola sp.]